MKTIKQNAVQRKAPPKISPIPWHFSPDGISEIEIARWFYAATESRNGGEWVYFIRVVRVGEISGPSRTVVSLDSYRFRENYVTKHPSDRQIVLCGPELEVSWPSNNLPDELLGAVKAFAERVSQEAEKDRERYERGAEARSW